MFLSQLASSKYSLICLKSLVSSRRLIIHYPLVGELLCTMKSLPTLIKQKQQPLAFLTSCILQTDKSAKESFAMSWSFLNYKVQIFLREIWGK